MSSKLTPCTCGARTKCEPREQRRPAHHLPAPGRPDPAEHWATQGGYDLITWLHGPEVAIRLSLYAGLWQRDGAGSRWHRDYWDLWDKVALPAEQAVA